MAANFVERTNPSRSYVSTCLPVLEDYDLLNHIGQSPNADMYEKLVADRVSKLEIRRPCIINSPACVIIILECQFELTFYPEQIVPSHMSK